MNPLRTRWEQDVFMALIGPKLFGYKFRDEGAWEWQHPFASKNPHAHHWKNRRGKR